MSSPSNRRRGRPRTPPTDAPARGSARAHRATPDAGAKPAPGNRERGLRLEITSIAGAARWRGFLRSHLRKAHAYLAPPLAELSLAIVGAKRMGALHEQFMADPSPTDVLTFELDHDARGRVTAGEVVVCLAVAGAEARRRNIMLQNELLLYALHGMLHLCGFDDRTTAAYRKMHRMEDRILTHLGIGHVFADVPSAKASPRRRASSDRPKTARSNRRSGGR